MKSNFLTGEKIAAMDHLEDQLIFSLYFRFSNLNFKMKIEVNEKGRESHHPLLNVLKADKKTFM